MYNKIHTTIKEIAEAQNCKNLLKLLKLADFYNLKFLYAYKKYFKDYKTGKDIIVKQIEVIDPYCRKNFKLNLHIIKSDKGSFISFSDTYTDEKSTNSFDFNSFNKYNKRIEAANNFLKELKKFNLEELPVIN